MAKPVKNNALMISIAEKVGATVGKIVAKTTGAVAQASESLKSKVNLAGQATAKATATSKAKRAAKPKTASRTAKAKRAPRKRKVPVEN